MVPLPVGNAEVCYAGFQMDWERLLRDTGRLMIQDHGNRPGNRFEAAYRSGRLALFLFLFLALSIGGTYAIYAGAAAHRVSLDPRLLRPPAVAGLAGLLAAYFASDGLRLYFTLRALGHHLPFGQLFRLVFINIFFSNVTPMATGGGFAQIWYLRRKGLPLGTATAATTVRTLLAVAVIFTATPAVIWSMELFQGNGLERRVLPALAAFAVLYLAFFATALFRSRWLIVPGAWALAGLRQAGLVGERRHRRWQFALKREMLRFARGFRDYLGGPPADVLLSMFFTVAFLLCLFSFPAVLLWALDYSVSYLTTLALLVVTTLVMYFSPTPGASGIAEGVFGHFFADLVSPGHLVLVTFTWRLLTIYLGMGVGLLVTQRELLRGPG